YRLMWRVVLMVAVVVWMAEGVPQALAQPARVPQTGQTECYSTLSVIPCAGTGQDGEFQAGVAFPAQRFRDNRDGTVRDNLTGLVWLQDANCFPGDFGPGLMKWQDALSLANNLAHGQCGLSDRSVAGDWRLPNVKELQSLIDFGQLSPALPADHPF